MLERTQVFVDTSYLLASFYNSWATGARAQLEIDLPEVVNVLRTMTENQLGQPVQRQLWYDGIPETGPHRYQRALRTCPGVQLRAGQLIEWGERRTQKAVDTRLVADMVVAGLRGQCSDIVLVSGDADMIPGVQEATAAGIRVHLYGFGWDSMSSALRHACDSTTILDPREDFSDCMQLQVLEGPVPPTIPTKPVGDVEPPEEGGPTAVPSLNAPVGSTRGSGGVECGAAGQEGLSTQEGLSAQDELPTQEAVGAQTGLSDEPAGEQAAAGGQPVAPTERPDPTPKKDAVDDRPHVPGDRGAERSPQAASGSQPGDFADACQPKPGPVPGRPAAPVSAASAAAAASPSTSASTPAAGGAPSGTAGADAPGAQEGAHAGRPSGAEPGGLDSEQGSDQQQDAQQPQHLRPEADPEADPEPGQAHHGEASAPESAAPSPSRVPQKRPAPNPSMMAPRRKLRSRYVPLPNEVWSSAGFQTPFDVGQQYASWWFENAASDEQRDQAHLLSGGGLPPEVDRPLLQFACETLHEYTLSESQRVSLRDGFHSGIRAVLISRPNR